MSLHQDPTPLEIKALAEDFGYIERRPEASCTLFFQELTSKEDNDACPNLINIFYTTRGTMTKVAHPTKGYNELWRVNAYDSLESLALLFENPRTHTGRGYRRIGEAVRGCAKCGLQKKRSEFNASQYRKNFKKSICLKCDGHESGENHHRTIKIKMEDVSSSEIKREDNPPALSREALERHNRLTTLPPLTISSGDPFAIEKENTPNRQMERRQFNCPLCPKHGRGKHIFFKRVPVEKPVVKCPKCKRVTRGNCERLRPIPRENEKGYGHFRCDKCRSTWGSSRAVAFIGQQCNVCSLNGRPNHMVQPFRIEVVKVGGITGNGIGRMQRMKRVPREVLHENYPDYTPYSDMDNRRNQNRGGNALVGTSANGVGRSFDLVPLGGNVGPDKVLSNDENASPFAKVPHKCEGCSRGLCRSRKMPVSDVHLDNDGNTASTSGSIITNSEVDKMEFLDQDIDFQDWELETEDEQEWLTVGHNGRILRG